MSTKLTWNFFYTGAFKSTIIMGLVVAFVITAGCSEVEQTGTAGITADKDQIEAADRTSDKNLTEAADRSSDKDQIEVTGITFEKAQTDINGTTTNNNTAGQDTVFPDVSRKPRVIENKYGIYYEIFVRSFADSDGDGIGDIKGLISMLDHLNDGNPHTDDDLGINGIYLMPVNVSPSYHKYDVIDYYNIDPEYGTLEDFELLLKEAHERGISVIMDLVINHTSNQHPWFKESASTEDSPYRDYYNWAQEDEEGSGSKIWHKYYGAYYYGYFWDGMPDLNYDNPKVREEIKDIARFWLEKGVDGFRLDAAMHIYGIYEKPIGTKLQEKNQQWWKEFGAAVEQVNPNVYLVGEVWEKTYAIAPYYEGLDSLFNFDVGEGIIKVIQTGTGTAVSSKGFSQWLANKYDTYSKAEPKYLDAPFLTNHDQNRIMDRLRGDLDKAKLAASIYLTLPGNPYIYYGEEIGMTGSKPDEMIRVPFIWFENAKPPQCQWESILNNASTIPHEIQCNDSDSLLHHYRRLIRVRQSDEILVKGSFRPIDIGNRAVIAYERYLPEDAKEGNSIIVLHNLSGEPQRVSLDIESNSAVMIFNSASENNGAPWKEELGSAEKQAGEILGLVMEIQPLSTIIIDAD